MIFLKENKTGLVIGNSTISAAVTPSGRLYGRILYNPPSFDCDNNSLREAGECGFLFETDGISVHDCELDWNITENSYPKYMGYTPLTDGIELSVCAFSPLSANDEELIFTPCTVTEFSFTNKSTEAKTVKVTCEWHPTKDALRNSFGKHKNAAYIGDGHYVSEQGNAFISAFGCIPSAASSSSDNGAFSITADVEIPAFAEGGAEVKAVFLLGIFDDDHRFKMRFDTSTDVCRYVRNNYSVIRSEIDDFISIIPKVGDDRIYLYTRWYMQAAVLLTKSARTGEVMTMGYTELNQRDSFWTSFLHVSLWSTLERDIIRLSARWMRPDGKIPTTILPRIERDFDIDINEYFCLRIARYYRYHKDVSFLEETYDAYRRSVDFLITFDRDGDGVPEQDTPDNSMAFWGDWKDVLGVTGRKLAPHFALLWLAVLKEGAYLAGEMEDHDTQAKYDAIYAKAYAKINRDVKDGGLWYEDHYVEVWYDGREMTEVLEDQSVGMIWGVVPEERVPLIYKALSRGENEFGIRETYPYRPDSFGYVGGDYHNGGIWPYLMFCDIMGRYLNGYADDAERLIGKVGHYDLEVPGDFAPNEYMNGDTGENCGKEIQGWSSALYGAITHGAFKLSHTGEREITVKVNFKDRDFETVLVLPKRFGRVKVSRKNGVLSCEGARKGYTVTAVEG